jgi:hypothetical protein
MPCKPGTDRREYFRLYYEKRVNKCKEMLGGKCHRCGSVDSLQFHHLDPEQKAFTISSNMMKSWERVTKELKKCELRCEPCHRLEHAAPAHGARAYEKGCRCDICRETVNASKRDSYHRRKEEFNARRRARRRKKV